jgi:hypothetical protein
MTAYTVVSDWIVINAPQRLVWDILVDFDSYPQWNSFTSEVHTDLTIDSAVELHVHLPKRGKRIQQEVVRTVQPPHTLAWGTTMGADFLLKALRIQSIEKLSAKQCRYRSTDELKGALTPLVKWLFAESMRSGFNAMALELKLRAEAQHQHNEKLMQIEGEVL